MTLYRVELRRTIVEYGETYVEAPSDEALQCWLDEQTAETVDDVDFIPEEVESVEIEDWGVSQEGYAANVTLDDEGHVQGD